MTIWPYKRFFSLNQKTYIRSSQGKSHAFMLKSPKQTRNRACGSLRTSRIQRKLSIASVSSVKLVIWRLFHWSNLGRSILSGTPKFFCLKSSEKFKKRSKRIIYRTALTSHPITYFRSHTSREKCVAGRRCWRVQKLCFGGIPTGVEKVLWQLVWGHAKV